MVDSKQVETTCYGGIGRQRGPGVGALAQNIGRIATPILNEYIFLAAKHMGADLLEIVASEFAEVVSGRKKFGTAAKSVGKQTLRQQLYSVTTKKLQTESMQQKLQKNQLVERRRFFKNFSKYSCRSIFSTNFLWQFLEVLEGKSQ